MATMKNLPLSKFDSLSKTNNESGENVKSGGDIAFRIAAPKKTRTKHSKVKTGCLTCKIRRVKCDEMKPHCNRCLRTGMQCDGYSTTNVQLRNKQEHDGQEPVLGLVSQSNLLYSQMNRSSILLNERDGRYFQYYCEISGAQIGGISLFNKIVWERLIPQISENVLFVSHALTALGAFTKARTESNESEIRQHHQFGLFQYSRALSEMRKSLNGSSYDAQNALVASLLVYIIESLQGHTATAIAHANSAEELLCRKDFSSASKRSPFRYQLDTSINDDLCRAFSDLNLQAILVIDNRCVEAHRHRIIELDDALLCMPSIFTSLKEAHDWLQLITRRNLHWIMATRRDSLRKGQIITMQAFNNEQLDLNNRNCPWIDMTAIASPELATRQECASYLGDLAKWENIAAPLLEKGLIAAEGSRELLVACALKIYVALMAIQLSYVFITKASDLDGYFPHFSTILTCVSRIRQRRIHDKTKYHFDLGFILPVLVVGIHCRHKELRTQAINLLSLSTGCREGIWDSDACLRIIMFVRDLEEEWTDWNGWVPAERRVTITRVRVLAKERLMYICGYQKNGSMDGGGVFRESYISF